ncbi:hypothetical protein HHK36_005137 [Tetracentron sinense]|uniref:Protein kinase domain-containing protein n=1 Tax=Tetracentron sinense TaxID=13715 RepID=A0A834ZNT8_TETSI|nr:hypothetical protein HHK36_005137 [Tetracentron sinense]
MPLLAAYQSMGGRWNSFGFQLNCFVLLLFLKFQECWALNREGLVLLEFRARVDTDPYGSFSNWNPNDSDPCMWFGVQCVDGKVQMLNLKGLLLEGMLAPELGKLSHLRFLVLYKNHFSSVIPKEIGGLTQLELLDLRDNNLGGIVPAEIGGMLSLKHLLLSGNKFHGSIPPELRKLNLRYELQFNHNVTNAISTGIDCLNRKFGHCMWPSSLKQLKKADSFIIPIKGTLLRCLDLLPLSKFLKGSLHSRREKFCDNLPSECNLFSNTSAIEYQKVHAPEQQLKLFLPLAGSDEPYIVQNVHHIVNFVRRRLLQESSNLPAVPASGGTSPERITNIPTTRSSGAFPAVANEKKKQSPPSPLPSPTDLPLYQSPSIPNPNSQSSQTTADSLEKLTNQQPPAHGSSRKRWRYVFVIQGVAAFLIIAAAVLCMCRSRGVTAIGPWKTGLSGQLQKAFVTGVPKLNRSELETACEDFSNIINTLADCTVYKGTLSSGVEIAVASTAITYSKDWSKRSEMAYRKKIDTLSRVNHKNFVNLIGYCEEDEPFLRMMVFEYAPNGTLFEHLHVKEVEHLDWNARMRIIMGTAYCLQYMHHELNPPVAHPNLQSNFIYLTDDYAAKIAEISFLTDVSKLKISGEDESEHSELPPFADPETNVYSFGILMLEIISGKFPYWEEQGSILNWAAEYFSGKQSVSYMIDPTLKSCKNNELDIICEVIQDCIQQDPRQRPTMREITSKLREVIAISPDAATPRLSPLWWAELEILSVEAT